MSGGWPVAPTATLLLRVQLGIGALHRIAKGQCEVQWSGPHARRHREWLVGWRERGERGIEPLADRARGRLSALAHERDELVATPSRHDVRLAKDARERTRGQAKSRVTGGVAVRIVDLLEAVEDGEHHDRRAVVATRPRQLLFREQIEAPAILQPGEVVHERERVQVALVAELGADVAREHHHGSLVMVDTGTHGQLDLGHHAARAHQPGAKSRCRPSSAFLARRQRGVERSPRIRQDEVGELPADKLALGRYAEQLRCRRIREEDPPSAMDDHRIGGQLEQLPIPVLGLAQCRELPARGEPSNRDGGTQQQRRDEHGPQHGRGNPARSIGDANVCAIAGNQLPHHAIVGVVLVRSHDSRGDDAVTHPGASEVDGGTMVGGHPHGERVIRNVARAVQAHELPALAMSRAGDTSAHANKLAGILADQRRVDGNVARRDRPARARHDLDAGGRELEVSAISLHATDHHHAVAFVDAGRLRA